MKKTGNGVNLIVPSRPCYRKAGKLFYFTLENLTGDGFLENNFYRKYFVVKDLKLWFAKVFCFLGDI